MKPIQKIVIVVSIAFFWVVLDYFNRRYFSFLQVSDFVYSIYWLSGVRLIAVILFGWLGVFGIGIGYVVGGIGIRGFAPQDAVALGVLSASAPLIAYRVWQHYTKITNDFKDVGLRQLFALVFLHSVLTAIFRNTYFYLAGKPNGLNQILTLFSANIAGTFILLYLFRYLRHFYKLIRR
jgi:hypothetical protein